MGVAADMDVDVGDELKEEEEEEQEEVGMPLELDEWTRLISRIEQSHPEDVGKMCAVYEGFLGAYPLCHVYWAKYAAHMARLRGADEALRVFEQAVVSAPYSLHLWLHYVSFATLVFDNPSHVRRLFNRALSFVGKDYSCHALWDKYVEFEFAQQSWASLAHIYIQMLRFPTKKLKCYYDRFRKLVDLWSEEMTAHHNSSDEVAPELLDAVKASHKQSDIDRIIEELVDPSLGLARKNALHKYINIGEQFYQKSSELDEKIYPYETRIKKSYFQVKPLDLEQLKNWHQYLDFVELDADFDWAVKLYERCLIPCANYPEFWMRYVEFMESKGGREIANLALDRATRTFLQRESAIHLFNARFKEHVGNILDARAAFLRAVESDAHFVEHIVMKANMERRLGNFDAASNTFKEALDVAAADQKWDIVSHLYIHFSHLTYMMGGKRAGEAKRWMNLLTKSEDAARDVLIDGIQLVPDNKLLIEELIKFAMTHGGTRHLNVVDSIIANAISPGPDVTQSLSVEDKESISKLYLQLVDLCGTIVDIRKAWYRHIRIFPHSMRSSFFPSPGSKRRQMSAKAPLQNESLFSEEKNQASHLVMNQPADGLPLVPDSLDDQVLDKELPTLENGNASSDQDPVDLVQSKVITNNVEDSGLAMSVNMLMLHEQRSEQQHPLNMPEPNTEKNDRPQSSDKKPEEVVQQDCDSKHDPDLNSMSLEVPSVDCQETRPPDPATDSTFDSEAEADRESCLLRLTSHEIEVSANTDLSHKRTPSVDENFQRNAASNRSLSMSSENANADRFCHKASENNSDVSSASKETTLSESCLEPHFPNVDRRKWHQRSNPDGYHRDSKFRSRGDSDKRQHRLRHDCLQPFALAERGSQMPSTLGQPLPTKNLQDQQNIRGQGHASDTPNHLGPPMSMQNLQSTAASQAQPSLQSATYPEAMMSPYSTQNSGQFGSMENIQAYNNYMWQYYYYQQQQILWQQQQQQPPHQHQLLQQQYQQHLMQMQLIGQQQLQVQQVPSEQQLLLQQSPQQQKLHLQQQQQLLQKQFQQQQSLYLQQQQQLQESQQFQQFQHHQHPAPVEQPLEKEFGPTGRQFRMSQEPLEGSAEKDVVYQGHMAGSWTPDTAMSSRPEEQSSQSR